MGRDPRRDGTGFSKGPVISILRDGAGQDGTGWDRFFSEDHGIVPTLVSANAHARVLPLGADKMHDASK